MCACASLATLPTQLVSVQSAPVSTTPSSSTEYAPSALEARCSMADLDVFAKPDALSKQVSALLSARATNLLMPAATATPAH